MENPDYEVSTKIIQNGFSALFLTILEYLKKEIELERIIKVAVLLIKSGTSKYNSVFQEITKRCLFQQKSDGGWIGIEDSGWSIAFLKEFEEYSQEYKRGLDWLKKRQLQSGGWGKTSRDIGRIPITGCLFFLLPELINKDGLCWIEKEWKKDFSLNPKLTYKGAFSLMALNSSTSQFIDNILFDKTLEWLVSQQNEDYGWGPCKDHSIGSTPFYTGVALTGLLQYTNRINYKVIVNGLKWLEKNQLENGLWPDHYIEEGSIWSFYALSEGNKFLKG